MGDIQSFVRTYLNYTMLGHKRNTLYLTASAQVCEDGDLRGCGCSQCERCEDGGWQTIICDWPDEAFDYEIGNAYREYSTTSHLHTEFVSLHILQQLK